jgi:hypothetical protein
MKKLIFGLLLLSSCSYNNDAPKTGSIYKCDKGAYIEKLEFSGNETVIVTTGIMHYGAAAKYTIDGDFVRINEILFKIKNQDTLLLQNNFGSLNPLRQDSIFVKVQ